MLLTCNTVLTQTFGLNLGALDLAYDYLINDYVKIRNILILEFQQKNRGKC